MTRAPALWRELGTYRLSPRVTLLPFRNFDEMRRFSLVCAVFFRVVLRRTKKALADLGPLKVTQPAVREFSFPSSVGHVWKRPPMSLVLPRRYLFRRRQDSPGSESGRWRRRRRRRRRKRRSGKKNNVHWQFCVIFFFSLPFLEQKKNETSRPVEHAANEIDAALPVPASWACTREL